MGLLDGITGNSWDDPRTMATLALAQGLLGGRNFSQGLLGGMQGYGATLMAAKDKERAIAQEALKARLLDAQIGETQAQAQQRAAEADKVRAQQAEAQRIQGLIQSQFQPVTGTQANAATGITGPRPEAATAIGVKPKVDYQWLIAQGVPPERAKALAESADYGVPTVARTITIAGRDGLPQEIQLDAHGRPVGQAFNKPVELQLEDMGGTKNPFNKFTGAIGAGIGKTMTPGEVASNRVALGNLGVAQQRLALDAGNAGNLVETPDGYVRVFGTQSQAVAAPGGGPRPLMGKGANMTEDQGKATAWLVQATNAFKNMQDASARTPGAEKPGFNDFLASVPSAGIGSAIGNSLRSKDRQQFMQGSSALSEALLRAATGAGINAHEAEQKIKELTPVYGDSDAVIKQKMDSIPLYIDSLKVRAGPGAKQAAAIFNRVQPMSGTGMGSGTNLNPDDPLGLRGGQ